MTYCLTFVDRLRRLNRQVVSQRSDIAMNRWKIPAWLERDVIERDRSCVYCGVSFEDNAASRGGRPS